MTVMRLKNILLVLPIAAITLGVLGGCATHPSNIRAGMSRDQLVGKFGAPDVERSAPDGGLLIYSTEPLGQSAYGARLGPDQRVAEVEQLLTVENFAAIKLGEWDRERVLTSFGPPAEVREFDPDTVWWHYRYKESGVWDSMMYIRFDRQGIVRQTMNGPDPLYQADVLVRLE